MPLTSEQIAHAARLLIPIGMGIAAFVLGLLRGDIGIMAMGAGLIGTPSVLRAISGTSPAPAPTPPAPTPPPTPEPVAA